MDSLIRSRIEARLLAAAPDARVARYLPVAIGADGAPALSAATDAGAVLSCVIDRVKASLTANHSGFITGAAVYRVYVAQALHIATAAARHAEFHARLDAIAAALLAPPRLGMDDDNPRVNMLRGVDSLTFDVTLGDAATASARQHLLMATIELTLNLYWQAT